MKRQFYPLIKCAARLSLTCCLILPALYYGGHRCGIIKFACCQRETQSMRDTWAIAHHPLAGTIINVALLIGAFLIVAILADLFRRQSTRQA